MSVNKSKTYKYIEEGLICPTQEQMNIFNNIEEVIEKSCTKFPERKETCNYDKSIYKNSKSKVEIGCNICGNTFFQIPSSHLSGNGCSFCCQSKTEKMARKFIEELTYCKFPSSRPDFLKGLELDCYNRDKKLAFEINGIQHYFECKFFHKTSEDFEKQLERDLRKNKLCKQNDILLIIIPYNYNYLNPKKLKDFIEEKLIEENIIPEIVFVD